MDLFYSQSYSLWNKSTQYKNRQQCMECERMWKFKNIQFTWGLGQVGILDKIRLEFPLWKSALSHPNICLKTSFSFWTLALARAYASFVMTATEASCSPSRTPKGSSLKEIPSKWKASPYFFHFLWYWCTRAWPRAWSCWKQYHWLKVKIYTV